LATNGMFSQGPIDFTQPVDPAIVGGGRPHYNNCYNYFGAVQWKKGTKWPVEPVVVSNACAPGTPVGGTAEPIVYA
jgi:hypothetical protein